MRLALAGVIALVLGGMAMAQTPFTIDYTIEIGGNNHSADFKNEVYKAFTPGTTTPPAQIGPGVLVTWDVVAAASGSDIDGWEIQGIANLVFDVELQTEAGTPVAPAEFLSTANDGNNDSARVVNAGRANEDFERAAFCLGWDVNMDYRLGLDGVFIEGGSSATGRLFDPVSIAGPNMDRAQFPSTSYHGGGRYKSGLYIPDCNGNNPTLTIGDQNADGVVDDRDEIIVTPALDGDSNGIIDDCENLDATVGGAPATEVLSAAKLSGMGVGYSQFSASANNLGVGLAVESVIPQWYDVGDEMVGIGIKPVAEGQIDMTGLPLGTYKLVLTVPDNANNVVPISYVPGAAGGFAVKADQVNGAQVLFFWDPGVVVVPVKPTQWQTVKTHGTAGTFGITLDPVNGNPAKTEPRNLGVTKIKIVFNGTLDNANYAPGGVVITGGLTVAPGGESLATTNVTNDTLVLTVTGSVDKTCYKIDVSGVCALTGDADPTCLVGALLGDVNGSRDVTTGDMGICKLRASNPPVMSDANCAADINLSGDFTTGDMGIAKLRASQLNPVLGACPP